jgi:transcriptional regulator with XRE-family HTH domain
MDPRDLRQAFADKLRRARHAKGISQEDLAHTAEVNRTYLSKLKKGVSLPRPGNHREARHRGNSGTDPEYYYLEAAARGKERRWLAQSRNDVLSLISASVISARSARWSTPPKG